MSDRTDVIYRLSHVADAFRGQRDTVVIEVEEAVLIVKDAEAENERLRKMVAKMWYTDAPFVTADGTRLLTPDEERLATECVVAGWHEADRQETT